MATEYMGRNALTKLCELVKSAISTLEAAIPTKTSDLTNDSDYITSSTLSNYATRSTMNTALEKKLDKSTITVKSAEATNVTVTTATATKITSITLSAGTWIIKGRIVFGNEKMTGYRMVAIGTTVTWNTDNNVLLPCANLQATRINTMDIVVLTASTTYYLVAYQNSGSTLICGGNLQAVRVK